MRFEDLGLIGTFACLHHQQPVWRPPNHIYLHKSHTTSWCASSQLRPTKRSLPEEKLLQCGHKYDIVTPPCPPAGAMMRRKWSVLLNIFLHGTQLSCLIFRRLFEGFLYSVKGPFRGFCLDSVSQSPPFNAKKACFIILGAQAVSLQHFTCSKYSLASDSCCHWPCIPSSFSITFHDAPSSRRPRTTATFVKGLSPLATRLALASVAQVYRL